MSFLAPPQPLQSMGKADFGPRIKRFDRLSVARLSFLNADCMRKLAADTETAANRRTQPDDHIAGF